MKKLKREDLIIINGGDLRTAIHTFGFRIGQSVADAVDFIYGIADGINNAFDE